MRYLITFLPLLALMGCNTMNYKASIKDAYERLENDDYRILKSGIYGNIQYKIESGNGIPVLVIHGISGGYDQGIQTAANLLPENHKILSVSRFGYLRSDVPDNHNPVNQCKALIEVMDHHNIDMVFILATSAGGTIAFRFALLYPERVTGLIMVASGYPSPEVGKGPKGPPSFIYNDAIFQFMLNNMQRTMLKLFGISRDEYTNAEISDQEKLHSLFNTILPVRPRKRGILIDQRYTNIDMNVNFSDYPLENIEKPFLILHAKNDPMAKYENLSVATERINNLESVIYETGGHVLFGHEKNNRKAIAQFIHKWSQ